MSQKPCCISPVLWKVSLVITQAMFCAFGAHAAIVTNDVLRIDTDTTWIGVTNIYTEKVNCGSINANLTLDTKSYVRLVGGDGSNKNSHFYIGTNTLGATVTVKGLSAFCATYRNSPAPAAWNATGVDNGTSDTKISYIKVHLGLPNGAPNTTGPSKFVIRDKSYAAFGQNQFGNIWLHQLIVEPSVTPGADGYVDMLDIDQNAYADVAYFENLNANPARIRFIGPDGRIHRNNATQNGQLFNVASGKQIVLEGVNGTDIRLHKQYHEAKFTGRKGGEVIFKGKDIYFNNIGEKGVGHSGGENIKAWILAAADNFRWQHTGDLYLDGTCWLKLESDDLLPHEATHGDIIMTADKTASRIPGNANNYVCICQLDLNGTTQQVNSVISRYNDLPYPSEPAKYTRGYLGVVTNYTPSKVGVLRFGARNNACMFNAVAGTAVKLLKEGTGTLTVKNSSGEDLEVQGGRATFAHSIAAMENDFGVITAAAGTELAGSVIVRTSLTVGFAEDAGAIEFGELDLDLATGAKVVIPDGKTLRLRRLAVGGVAQEAGSYTGKDWLENGTVEVICDDRAPADITWTAGAGANTSAALAANWGGTEPDFSVATRRAVFATTGTLATFTGESFLSGILFDAPGDFTLASPGALLKLYGALSFGPADTTPKTYEIQPTVGLRTTEQEFVIPTNVTMRFSGGLSSTGFCNITLQGVKGALVNEYPGGRLELVDAKYNGSLTHNKGGHLYVKGELGVPGDSGVLTLYNGAYKNGSNINDGWAELGNTTFDGVTVWKETTIGSYGQVTGATNSKGWFRTLPGTTNVFKEVVKQTASMRYEVGDNSTVIFEKGYQDAATSGSGAFNTCADDGAQDATYVFNGPVKLYLNYKDLTSYGSSVRHVWNTTGCIERGGYQLANTIADFRQDYVFTELARLQFNASSANAAHTILELNGTKQRVGMIYTSSANYGTIHGDWPAELEVTAGPVNAAASGVTNLNVDVTGWASLRMSGSGYLLLKKRDYSSYGDLAVSCGTMELAQDATWLNGTNVTVSGSGVLKIGSSKTFGRQAVLRISDSGRFSLPATAVQRVAECWVGGEKIEPGIYEASGLKAGDPLYGHLEGGTLRVGSFGLMLLVR